MSATDDLPDDPNWLVPADQPPADREFDLEAAYDDPTDPSELTVFPADADEAALATAWLTMDVAHVRSLAAMR